MHSQSIEYLRRTLCTYVSIACVLTPVLYRCGGDDAVEIHILTFGTIETKNFAFPYLRCK